MTRFILLSFALMGWAFYELSGGADFQPRVAVSEPDKPAAKAAGFPRPATRAETAALIATPARIRTTPAPKTRTTTSGDGTADPVAKPVRIRTSLTQGLSLYSDTDPSAQLTLVSLEQGATSLVSETAGPQSAPDTMAAAAPQEPDRDLREVTGTRVNMRDGPGTIYPVIQRLKIGHSVEVLDDSGTGWLRLRTLPDQQIGWISASLISKPAR